MAVWYAWAYAPAYTSSTGEKLYLYDTCYLLFFVDACLVCMSICSCIADSHPQEKQLYLCDTCYLLCSVVDCLLCMSICSCIPDRHPQEKQLYLCDTCYLLFCVDDRLVCRVERNCINTVISPDDGHIVARNMWRKYTKDKSWNELSLFKKLYRDADQENVKFCNYLIKDCVRMCIYILLIIERNEDVSPEKHA